MDDARYAFRGLLRSPGFAAVAILSLALGIGANVAIYTIANAFLSRPIAGVAEPDRLVRIYRGSHSALQYMDLAFVRDNGGVFSGVIGEHVIPVALTNIGGAERVIAAVVTPGYFSMLGVRPAAGRLFGTDSLEQSVVLSHGFWERRFGGDPRTVRQTIRVNDRAFAVVGVAPPDFAGSMSFWGVDLWLSPAAGQAVIGASFDRWGGSLYATGRLRDGVTLDRANVVLATLARRIVAADTSRGREFSLRADDANGVTAELRQPALLVSRFLLFVVGLVLLIACANVANLLLARAAGRGREIAMRFALGARRVQLLRLLLVESGMLTIAASVIGSGVALWSVGALGRYVMTRSPEPILLSFALDRRVLIATLALALFTTLLFGLLPALRATSLEMLPVLRESAPQSSGRSRMRGLLVGTQVALCAVLLACATLFLRSLAHARVIDPGFETAGIVDLPIDLGLAQLDSARAAEFYRRLLERVDATPSVRSATLAALVPLGGSNMQVGVWTPEVAGTDSRAGLAPYFNVVGPDYFRTLGIGLVAGRDFGADVAGSEQVAIVNEQMARRLAPDGQVAGALGRRFSMSGPTGPWITVIGVARDVRYNTLGEKTPEFMYRPLAQLHRADMVLQVKTLPGNEAALRRTLPAVVRELEARLPPPRASSLSEDMRISLLGAQIGAALLGAFGALALLLATIGIYGVASYSVAQRTRELGIRSALGATSHDVVRMVIGQSLRVASIGTAIGLLLAMAVAKLIASQLYGVGATDPVTFIGMPVFLVGVALVATLAPAIRATRVDPAVALRSE